MGGTAILKQSDSRKLRLTFADRFHNEATAWVVLVVSLMFTVLSWWISQHFVQQRAKDRFTFEVERAQKAILNRMKEYEQVLRGGAGLLISSSDVTRQDWHNYVSNLEIQTYWPGIQGIGYAVMVSPEQKQGLIDSIRREGFHNFDIKPQGVREQYSSIIYLEPFNVRNQRAFGYDMYSEPTRRTAMINARDTGKLAVSAKVTLVQETDKDIQAGFLMFLPHYRRGMPLETPEQRQAALVGYVYSPFRAKDLMHGILGPEMASITFKVYDGKTIQTDALLYASASSDGYGDTKPIYTTERHIELPGRTWIVRFDSNSSFEQEWESSQPMMIVIGGGAVDILLFVIIMSLSNSRKRDHQARLEMSILLDRIEAAASAGIIGIWDWDVVNNKLVWDKVMYQLYGMNESDFGGAYEAWASALHPDDKEYAENEIRAALRGEREYAPEFRVIWPDGSVHYLKAVARTTYDEQGKPIRMIGVNYDLTEQKKIQQELDKQASLDQLTGLPNRRLLDDRIEQALARAKRDNQQVAICFLDLDNFKQVNDLYGHAYGDKLLKQAAGRIQKCLRTSDTVARIGGDEFIVLLPETGINAAEVAEKIRDSLHQPFILDDSLTLSISSSIGIAIYPDHATNIRELMQHGDEAMYEAKKSGRNAVVIFKNLPSAPSTPE